MNQTAVANGLFSTYHKAVIRFDLQNDEHMCIYTVKRCELIAYLCVLKCSEVISKGER